MVDKKIKEKKERKRKLEYKVYAIIEISNLLDACLSYFVFSFLDKSQQLHTTFQILQKLLQYKESERNSNLENYFFCPKCLIRFLTTDLLMLNFFIYIQFFHGEKFTFESFAW